MRVLKFPPKAQSPRSWLFKVTGLGRYGMVSAGSLTVSLGLPIVFVETGLLEAPIATALSLSISFLLNFVAVKLFVYRDDGPWLQQFLSFGIFSLCFRSLEYAGFYVLHTFAGAHYTAALFLVLGCSFVAKYFFYGKVLFKSKRPESL